MTTSIVATTREERDSKGNLVDIIVSMPTPLGKRLNTEVPVKYASGISMQSLVNGVIAAMAPMVNGQLAGTGAQVLTDAQVKAIAIGLGAVGLS